MGFAGNLSAFPLVEVIQTIGRLQGTGVLSLVHGDTSRQVVFQDGAMIGVELPAGTARQALLRRLAMQGLVPEERLAGRDGESSPSQLLSALVRDRVLPAEALGEALRTQTEEEIFHLLTWPAADFVFRDASPEEPEAAALVERTAVSGLVLNTNSLLMEAARRADEYARTSEVIGDPARVPGAMAGREGELAEAGRAYPASAVVPLIDAVRSVDDIAADSVVTRPEVYEVLAGLIGAGLIAWLSREDLAAHAAWLAEQGDHVRAAHLLRRVLAIDPGDHAARTLLAGCIEHLADGAEAAACHEQTARLLLDDGAVEQAAGHARRAVELAPRDARLRKALVRCLLAAGDQAGAVAVLREVVGLHQQADQLEEARAACLQVLQLVPGDEDARRELARIFSRVEGDLASEDVVVCVQCGHVNHREATACTQCSASLQLACQSCGRVVAVSDRLCIFCGADPHGGDKGRRAGGAPATSRVIHRRRGQRAAAADIAAEVRERSAGEGSAPQRTQAGTGSGSRRLDALAARAQAREEAGELEAALVLWRQVSSAQPDNANLLAHLKLLEAKIQEQVIERLIETGHRQRRSRRCGAAVGSYRQALHLLGAHDPRVEPVRAALARAERDRLRIGAVYGAAALVLAVLGWFAVHPFYTAWWVEREAGVLRQEIAAVSAPAGLAAVNATLDRLGEVVAGMPGAQASRGRRILDGVGSELAQVEERLARTELERAAAAIRARDAATAQAVLDAYATAFRAGTMGPELAIQSEALAALRRQLKLRADEIAGAPDRLAAAAALESGNRLGEALAAYRALLGTPNAAVADSASKAAVRLEPRARAFEQAWAAAMRTATAEPVRAEEVLGALMVEARSWGHDAELRRLREAAATRLAAAAQAWTALGERPGSPSLEAFIAAHPGTPQAAAAQERLADERRRQASRSRLMDGYRQHLDARRWPEAHQAATALMAAGAGPGDGVVLPLVVDGSPAGASVQVDGVEAGRLPALLRLTPGAVREVVVSAPGFEPMSVPGTEAAATWRLTVRLQRRARWSATAGRPVLAMAEGPGGVLLLATADGVAAWGRDDGARRWRCSLGGDDLVGGRRSAVPPAFTPDGQTAALVPGVGAVLVSRDGVERVRLPAAGEVRGRPLAYVNEVFGPELRLALAGEALVSASPGTEIQRIALPAPAIAGPVAVPKDLDRILVVATADGWLRGFEESSRRQVWRLDVHAADCGQLQLTPGQLLLAVLDGSRLGAWRVSPVQAVSAWTHTFPATVVGQPLVVGRQVLVATGSEIRRIGLDGTVLPAWRLPAAASTGPAAAGDLVAVGCQDATLALFRGDAPAWTAPCGRPVTAVAVAGSLVVAALADGTVTAFPP